MTDLPSNFFVVSARQGACCRQFIVLAINEEDACARLRANATAMIEAIKAGLNPEDYETAQLLSDPLPHSLKRAYELEDDVRRMEEKLSDLDERTDDLAVVHRESLTEGVRANWEQIKNLRAPIPSGTSSNFKMIARPMLEILEEGTSITAKKLDGNRCYTASYFDDFRSYSSHCG